MVWRSVGAMAVYLLGNTRETTRARGRFL